MNIKTRVIQSNSLSFDIKNNTSSLLIKQSCLFKITWPKKVIPTKSYGLAMLHLHHTKHSNHAQPRWQAEQLFHTLVISNFFQLSRNTWAWAMDIAHRWNRIWWWRLCGEDKKGESLTSTRLINVLWRCPSIDVNVRSRDCHATDALEI